MQTIFEIVCRIKIIVVYLYQQKNNTDMTTQEINKARNEGIFSASNDAGGWYAISRDNINMITFANGKSKIYTEKGFAKRITQLLNRGF